MNEDIERVFGLFPRLAERRAQKAGTLSGGEQQMCAMGRALMARPKLLLLDEPSMGLAPVLVERIFEIVTEINQQGTTILLVEQNALMALDVASRGYVLETGVVALTDDAASAAHERARAQGLPRPQLTPRRLPAGARSSGPPGLLALSGGPGIDSEAHRQRPHDQEQNEYHCQSHACIIGTDVH